MKLYWHTIAAEHIRQIFNSSIEGTATDALIRHDCRVALGECCIGMEPGAPMSHRYPTTTEIQSAKTRLAKHWNARHA